MKSHSELFDAPVDVKKLVSKLPFDEDGLEEAAMENAGLLFEAGRYRLQAMRRKSKATRIYDRAFAEARLVGRRKKDSTGKKVTESAVADIAQISKDVIHYRISMEEAAAQEELSKTLLECFRQRRDMLRGIIEIRSSETSARLRQVRGNMMKDEAEKLHRSARQRVREIEGEE